MGVFLLSAVVLYGGEEAKFDGRGPVIGVTHYSFDDWDDAWGYSIGYQMLKMPTNQDPTIVFGGIRVGYVPLKATQTTSVDLELSHQSTISGSVSLSFEGGGTFI